MALSGSRDFIQTRDDIIEASLRKLNVLSPHGAAETNDVDKAAEALNRVILDLQNEDIFLWTEQDDIQLLTADTANYTLDADIIEIKDVFFRQDDSDKQLTPITREEYKAIPDKKESGTPVNVYVDYQLAAPVAYLWPVPENSTGIIAGTDTNDYLCYQNHTSTTDNKPITGSDYADVWEQVAGESSGVWAVDTEYKSDIVRYTKVLRLQDFDASTDNPDFHVRWYSTLVALLTAELGPDYDLPEQRISTLISLAENKKQKAKNANSESADLQLGIRLR
jgi:hypothetical protein